VIRGAVFDFDGVVVDSHPAHLRAWKSFLNSVGKTVSEEQLHFALDGRKRDEILRHFMGELDADRILEYGLRKEQFFRDEVISVKTVDGLADFLESLQSEQLAVAIASSGSKNRIHFLLDRFGLKKYFQEVVSGDEVEHGKPHPALFLKAAERLGLDPSLLVVFEDAVSGVEAAKSAGMKCVGIAGLDRVSILLAAGADHVVPDFRSLSFSKLQEVLSNCEEASSSPARH
jgi:beta-phosphoglucomutase